MVRRGTVVQAAPVLVVSLVILHSAGWHANPVTLLVGLVSAGYLPGRLLLEVLETSRRTDPATRLLYSVGMSIGLLLVMSLAVDSAGALLGVEEPLRRPALLAGLGLLIGSLALLAHRRAPTAGVSVALPIDGRRDRRQARKGGVMVLVGVCLPFAALAAASAADLGYSWPAIAVLGGVTAAAVLLCSLTTLPDWVYAAVLGGVALAVVYLFSQRGDYLNGSDILSEYRVYQLTVDGLDWVPSVAYQNAYNACLSITLLPVTLQQLTGLDGLQLFRSVLPAVAALIAPATFVLARRYVSRRLATLAALLAISYSSFVFSLPMHVRQAVALGLFALLVLALTDPRLGRHDRFVVGSLLGIGVALSHYSSAYVAVVVLGLSTGFVLWRQRRRPAGSTGTPLGGAWPVVLGLAVLTALWFGPVTGASSGLVEFAAESLDAVPAAYSTGDPSLNPLGALFPWSTSVTDSELLLRAEVEAAELAEQRSGTRPNFAGLGVSEFEPSPTSPIVGAIGTVMSMAALAISYGVRIAVVLGVVTLVCRKRPSPRNQDLRALTVACAVVLVAAFAVPLVSVSYSVERLYQQLLAVLAVPAVIGLWAGLRLVTRRHADWLAATVVIAYLAFGTGLLPFLAGTSESRFLQFHNRGVVYEQAFTQDGDVDAARWLADNYDGSVPIRTDNFGWAKLQAWGPLWAAQRSDVLATDYIGQDDYVFLTAANMQTGRAYVQVDGKIIGYELPLDSLLQGRSLLYSSGAARVYR